MTPVEAASLARRRRADRLFQVLAFAATAFGVGVLAVLVWDVVSDGLPRLSWQFLTSYPSRKPAEAGILSALVGSVWMLVITATFAFPIGVATAVYLEEYAPQGRISNLLEINISNLAGVPSIIYGLLGLEVFVRIMRPLTGGRSVLAGSLTMALLVVPIVIISAREAIRAVPESLRLGGYALGATRWQVTRGLVLPAALSGIFTGTILALARAAGETAPLITIGALTYIAFLPDLSLEGLQTPFTVLPIQYFNWISRPQPGFHVNAAAAIVVLLVLLLAMNGFVIWLRARSEQAKAR